MGRAVGNGARGRRVQGQGQGQGEDKSENFRAAPRRSAGAAAVTARAATTLSRAHLEEAFTKLSEENAHLRDQIVATGSLWQIAHQDPLTELWNRRYADQRLAEEMSRAQRESGYRFSMVLVDVDNLKRINDHEGHRAGDEALQWVARLLRQGLRGHDLCCRLGGDEFLLVLPGSGEKECRDLVARLRRRWQDALDRDPSAVAVSMGCASFPSQGSTVAGLLAVADDAMYANKRSASSAARPARTQAHEGKTHEGKVHEGKIHEGKRDSDKGDDDSIAPPATPHARLVSC